MLDYIQKNPDYVIDVDLSTNKGTIKYAPIGEMHSVSEFLFANDANKHDLYNITVSAKDNIGITVVIDNRSNGTKFYDVRGGNGLKTHIGNFNDIYQKDGLAIQSGLLIYFYDTNNGQRIGVPMPSQPIGKEDALKLTHLIQSYINGERYANGYDILDLLRQRLYIKDPERYLTEYNKIGSMVTITNKGV